MNFFFGLKTSDFKSKLKIPIFQNEGKIKTNYNLYCLSIKKNNWILDLYSDKSVDNFYFVKSSDCNNDSIFF